MFVTDRWEVKLAILLARTINMRLEEKTCQHPQLYASSFAQ